MAALGPTMPRAVPVPCALIASAAGKSGVHQRAAWIRALTSFRRASDSCPAASRLSAVPAVSRRERLCTGRPEPAPLPATHEQRRHHCRARTGEQRALVLAQRLDRQRATKEGREWCGVRHRRAPKPMVGRADVAGQQVSLSLSEAVHPRAVVLGHRTHEISGSSPPASVAASEDP